MRGRELLAAADVVVTDRLGPRELLVGAELRRRGRRRGEDARAPPDQPGADQRDLVDHARLGRHVVRLKGGDPFVLGRGGEEALALPAHGVPVEVVPGVTSAVSVPAAAGIPVTHRGITASFVVASAHEGADPVLDACGRRAGRRDARPAHGGDRGSRTPPALVESGRPPSTPVALVERGWTPEQRTTVTTLATPPRRPSASGVGSRGRRRR